MEYLNKVLGIEVAYEDVEFKHLPNFIVTRYRLQMVSMNEQKMIFLYPKTELSISRASKQLEEMELLHIKKEGVPQFYRFSHPITNQYPAMIELFTRKLDAIQLPEDADEQVEEAMEEC